MGSVNTFGIPLTENAIIKAIEKEKITSINNLLITENIRAKVGDISGFKNFYLTTTNTNKPVISGLKFEPLLYFFWQKYDNSTYHNWIGVGTKETTFPQGAGVHQVKAGLVNESANHDNGGYNINYWQSNSVEIEAIAVTLNVLVLG